MIRIATSEKMIRPTLDGSENVITAVDGLQYDLQMTDMKCDFK